MPQLEACRWRRSSKSVSKVLPVLTRRADKVHDERSTHDLVAAERRELFKALASLLQYGPRPSTRNWRTYFAGWHHHLLDEQAGEVAQNLFRLVQDVSSNIHQAEASSLRARQQIEGDPTVEFVTAVDRADAQSRLLVKWSLRSWWERPPAAKEAERNAKAS